MKRLIVFACCLVLGIAVAAAAPGKKKQNQDGSGKRQAQQAARGGGGSAGKRLKANHPGMNRPARVNAAHTGGRRAGGAGGKAARKAKFREGADAEGANVATGKGKLRAGAGRRAQVKHFDFQNTRRANIESVTFRANRRIVGAERWHGERYVVFRNYRPLWHDHVWWHAHYPRIVLIGGGWYYWNAGFWYPAWGYDPGASVYAYDGPIYAYNDLPPDQVVANVQTALQEQGYYQGEIDGMLGPLTRAALAQYQADHGLYTTSAIDEPTMSSLGFS